MCMCARVGGWRRVLFVYVCVFVTSLCVYMCTHMYTCDYTY